MIEQRREPRFESDERGVMHMLYPQSPEPVNVRIVNVSKSGMCVRTPIFLVRNSEVKVAATKQVIIGQVRYCVPARDGFQAGLRIVETL